jgi:hypothetical protein
MGVQRGNGRVINVRDKVEDTGIKARNTQFQEDGAVVAFEGEVAETPADNQSYEVATNVTDIVTTFELSYEEERDRLHLEQRVERAFYQAGKALEELHNRKLYRSTHRTFEEYCKDRFGFERRHPYRLIEAAGVVDNLIKMCPNGTQNELELDSQMCPIGTQILPTNERQVRALVPLLAEEQFNCWQQAVDIAGGKVPSGRIVKDIVERIRERTAVPIPYSVGEVCIIIIKDNPELRGKSGHWCIINRVTSFSCGVKMWDGEYTVKPENLKSLDFLEDDCLAMSELCFRLRRLYDIKDLDEVAVSLLNSLGKRTKPYLTSVQEKVLAVIEQEYGIK